MKSNTVTMIKRGQRKGFHESESLINLKKVTEKQYLPVLTLPHNTLINFDNFYRHTIEIKNLLKKHGIVLIKKIPIDQKVYLSISKNLCKSIHNYIERSTPRQLKGNFIYSASEYSNLEKIYLHNENSYAAHWPQTLFFFCEKAANQGGENIFANTAHVLENIPNYIVKTFIDKKVLYRRQFIEEIGVSWKYAFQVESASDLEKFLEKNQYSWQWEGDGILTVERQGLAIHKHPSIDVNTWFNHVLFFHESSLNKKIKENLFSLYGNKYLPFSSYYGNYDDIEDEVLTHIRTAYDSQYFRIGLEQGDCLILDNMMMAHGRLPFSGRRDIRLIMAGELK